MIPEEKSLMKSAPRGRLTSLALVLAMLALPVASFAADEGADLFKSKCAMCHGLDGAGKTLIGEKLKIPDLHSADVQKKSDTDLQTILAKGQGKMPAYEAKLSKAKIEKLVAYV